MKRLLFAPIILVTSLVASLALGLELGDLVERDGLSYEKFTNVPFTGEVTGLEQGGFLNGKREGLWDQLLQGWPATVGRVIQGRETGRLLCSLLARWNGRCLMDRNLEKR